MTQLHNLLSDLVRIDSINPDLVPGAAGEGRVAAFMVDWLKSAGLDVHLDEVAPGRSNVIAVARGSGGGKTLLLNGHIDTVGVAGMNQPHAPRIENGRLYGRGGYDMKAGVAACMVTVAAAKQQGLRGDVIFTGVIDEEFAGAGTLDVAKRYKADAAIVAEPTSLELVIAHKGFAWLDVVTQGLAGHGSQPKLGVDAIVKMGRVLTELEQLDRRLRLNPTHPLLGSGSVHASLITGGQELSSYPERCTLQIERRLVPGETPALAQRELQDIVDGCAKHDPQFKAKVTCSLDRTPLETDPQDPFVQLIQHQAAAVLGAPPKLIGAPFWTDAASLAAAGIPSVLFGAHGAGAHAVEEWVDLNSVDQSARIYLEIVQSFCG